MALSDHIKNAYDARLAAAELRNAAGQLAFAMNFEGITDNGPVNACINTLFAVADDYDNWSEGKDDHEEVFYPPSAIAKLDQLDAEIRNRYSN